MKQPKISIIVPVYNAEKYLRQCLDSILNQSFSDFEVLLVDDGSKDDSEKICDEYAVKDKRVHVCHQANQGVSVARNVGLENAQGEWMYFPDADDIVMPNALNMMMSFADKTIEYIMCGYEVYDENGACTYSIEERKQKIIDRDAALIEMFAPTDYRYQGYLWNKLFRASIIKENSLSFVRGIKFNEDRLFNVEYLCHVKYKVVYTTTPIYQYIERTNSAMASLTQRFNPAFITDLDAFVRMRKVLLKTQISKDIITAHADAMYHSVGRYYSMCNKFAATSVDKVWKVETRLYKGVGFRKYLYYRITKIKRKINKLCKNS